MAAPVDDFPPKKPELSRIKLGKDKPNAVEISFFVLEAKFLFIKSFTGPKGLPEYF